MKINKQLASLAVLGLCVGSVQAVDSWTETGPSAQNVSPGQSGTSAFIFEQVGDLVATIPNVLNSGGNPGFWVQSGVAFSGPAGIFNSFSVISVTGPGWNSGTGAVIDGQPFSVNVAWTINPSATVGSSSRLTANISTSSADGDVESASGGKFTVVASVPEPAQTVAGAMLLGCGGLMFAGRRLFKKQAA